MVNSEQRRRQLAREKFERQQRRRAEIRTKARRRNVIIASALAVVLAAGGGAYAIAGLTDGGGDGKDVAQDSPSAPPSPSASKKPAGPKMTIDAKAKYTMSLKTSQGDIGVAMDAAKTPETVNSFKSLADKKYFDGTKCHRLTTENIFVLQCGDPKGDGTGGPGYTIADENLTALGKPGADGSVTFAAGTVAMANTGQPNSGGSQFFLVWKDTKLPPSYTPFGKLDAEGLKTVKAVAAAGVAGGAKGDGAPKKTVTIEKGTVDKV
ncbi:peptidylprolyl isomerase [Streptomyces sp. NBC_01498]|uniref:peptidylprolyl isomerase n=1 Tax=Streptomyces sp. NBC_01498 TaxID=2975870 RepID=UPI002E7BD851|nr:peptidylprolyl isomerase [Streptomyces sp. NBC_01498]WTL27842.1 peptidylprolyl isomerase [Streptomyces sp. NBC_01498]